MKNFIIYVTLTLFMYIFISLTANSFVTIDEIFWIKAKQINENTLYINERVQVKKRYSELYKCYVYDFIFDNKKITEYSADQFSNKMELCRQVSWEYVKYIRKIRNNNSIKKIFK